jgi:benzylsuccinate CoA-transferase BbsE subunit
MQAGALAGLRVVDLASRQGAFAGKLLADLGADVVKVEPPGGDAMRSIPPFWQGVPHPDRSLFFWFYNTSKRGITLDWTRPAGTALLRRLVDGADVLIETEPPGRLADLGCDPADLRAGNPRLVVASITPFGERGPYRDWRASDTVAQAMGGMLFVNGHPGRPPLRSLGLQAYHQAGVFAAIGIVSALLARDRTGRGQDVDVSLQAAVAGALEHVPGLWHQTGVAPRRQGTLHWTRYFRVGRCRDGWVMHCTLGDWTSLLEWVKADGMEADLGDPGWDDLAQRKEHAEHLFDVLDAWAARHTVAELHEGAQLRRIPYAAVRAPEALLSDPHLAARGFFVPIEHPELGTTVPYPGPPFRLGEGAWAIARRPPRVGEHNREVYGALGLDAVALAAEGVL